MTIFSKLVLNNLTITKRRFNEFPLGRDRINTHILMETCECVFPRWWINKSFAWSSYKLIFNLKFSLYYVFSVLCFLCILFSLSYVFIVLCFQCIMFSLYYIFPVLYFQCFMLSVHYFFSVLRFLCIMFSLHYVFHCIMFSVYYVFIVLYFHCIVFSPLCFHCIMCSLYYINRVSLVQVHFKDGNYVEQRMFLYTNILFLH